jgi:hypothetical protein
MRHASCLSTLSPLGDNISIRLGLSLPSNFLVVDTIPVFLVIGSGARCGTRVPLFCGVGEDEDVLETGNYFECVL